MEPPEVPVYPLQAILDMSEGHIPKFLSILGLSMSDDPIGQIVLALNQRDKLTYLWPIISSNLEVLIESTTSIASNDRYQVMMEEATKFFAFSALPPELQLAIVGQVSPTTREATIISKGMKVLADVALIDNIRTGNVVDPSIGMPNREQYFKVKPGGVGEYFSLIPGLGLAISKARKRYLVSQQAILLYGRFNIGNITKFRYPGYGPDPIKFVAIARMASLEQLLSTSVSLVHVRELKIAVIKVNREQMQFTRLSLHTRDLFGTTEQISSNKDIAC